MQNQSISLISSVIGRGQGSAAATSAAHRIMRHFGSMQEIALATKEELKNAGGISETQANTFFPPLRLVAKSPPSHSVQEKGFPVAGSFTTGTKPGFSPPAASIFTRFN